MVPATKKNYAYHAVVQENYPVDFKENKGFEKSQFSEFSNEFMKRILAAIYEAKDNKAIYTNIFKLFQNGKQELKDDMKAGGFIAFSRLKWGHAGKYGEPWAQYQFVSGEINNILYQQNKTASGERVAYLKLLTPKIPMKDKEQALDIYLDFITDKIGVSALSDKIRIETDRNEEFKEWFLKNGLKSIGIPLATNEKIPDELVPLIDVETMVGENLFSRTGIFLDLLGISAGKGNYGVYGGGNREIKEFL